MRVRLVILGLAAAVCANAYTWDFSSGSPWSGNGSFAMNGNWQELGGTGMTFPGGGSFIWTPTVSGANQNDYTINTTLADSYSADTFVHFLRASSSTVQQGVGSYISAELNTFGYGTPSTLNIKQRVSGTISLLASAQVAATPASFQTVIFGTNLWVFVNGTLVMQQTLPSNAPTTGQPGVGGTVGSGPVPDPNDPCDGILVQEDYDAFVSVQIGQHWTTAPPAISSAGFSSMAYPTTVAMKWQQVSPGSDPGILYYAVTRNSTFAADTTFNNPPEYNDVAPNVQPGTTYSYTIQTVDIHGNFSTGETFSITTPPSGTGPGTPPNSFNPLRTGVQATGSYWGGGGEQIDTMSGNLNFSFPILSAQGRNSWTVPVNLVYNSQNWQQGNGVNWQYGYDVGFGFGWKMLIGSITPNNGSGSGGATSYTFTDNTGAQYLLNQNNGGVWSSQQGIYVWFDANADKLHFKDGTFWTMGSVSGGTEADAGTLYPTIIEDVNGNQVIVAYDKGAGMSTTNTSARIVTIEDVRAIYTGPNCNPNTHQFCVRLTYTFTYDHATPVSHLASLTNPIGTPETGTFTYTAGVELSPPFGADPAWYGVTTTQLASYQVGSPILNISLGTYQFAYDTAGAQELMQVTFPWGGHLAWTYATFTYAGGRSLREVSGRSLAADSAGANVWTYPITRPDAANSVQVHSGMTLTDASANGAKTWSFLTTSTAPYTWEVGFVSDFRQLATAGSTNAITHDTYTWSQNASSNPFILSKTSVQDEGTGNAQSALSTQAQDSYGFGNTIQSVIFPYNNTTTALNTYNSTFLDDSTYASGTYNSFSPSANYIENYIRNRAVSTTLTTGGTTYPLVTNYYDKANLNLSSNSSYCLSHVPNLGASSATNEVDSSPPIALGYRGTSTGSLNPAVESCVTSASGLPLVVVGSDGSSVTNTTTSTTNYAAPSSIATQTYSETIGYNSWLGVTSTTGANGEQLSMTYDASGRPTSGTSPYGAVTTYTYSAFGTLPMQQMKTGPDGFTRTTLDGLGRTILVERGPNSSTIQSLVATVYQPCACSPLGKVQKTSQPYAPGGTPVWTVYTYDGIGRTLSVQQPDGASTTTYSYSGNTSTVTDPAGNWKTFTSDVLGNLITVVEPDPANQPGGTLTTSYTYDWMKHVSQVSMTRAGTTQTRSFAYSNGGLLTSATNPENGTVLYYYNTNNTLQYKHDAKGQDTVYTYDSKQRVTMIQKYPSGKNNAEDQWQRVTYSYDTNPYSSTYSQYTTGRLTATQYNASPASGGQWITEMYSYHPAGAMTGKSLQVGSSTTNTMSVSYAYNSAGQVYTMQYPASTSPTLTYGYDSMARLNSLTSQVTGYSAQTLVQNADYDLAGRMNSIQYLATVTSGSCGAVNIYTQETMSYNTNGQLASLNWGNGSSSGCTAQYIDNGPVGGITYNYSSTQNNGQITQAVDTLSGETISYAYDALKRLTSASSTPISGSTPTAWTETFQYDGFGNLTAKVLNGTSTPVAVNAATNQLTYASYDSNGNMTSGVGATLTYDVSNRMVSAAETSGGIEYYGYAPDNKRVFRQLANGTQQVTFYGAKGEKLAIGIISGSTLSAGPGFVYFGGKLISDPNGPVYPDRLGTNRSSGTGSTTTYNSTYSTTNNGARFLPFGDEITSTANDHVKFGTYTRDSYTGLDYADQRFYASTYGRFNTQDPFAESGGPGDPGSWNRYSYTEGDPINFNDPQGLFGTCPSGQHVVNNECVPDSGGGDSGGSSGGTKTKRVPKLPNPERGTPAPPIGSRNSGTVNNPACSAPKYAQASSFINANLASAQVIASQLNTNVGDILGLAGLESGWGTGFLITAGTNNYFSLTAGPAFGGTVGTYQQGSYTYGVYSSFLSSGESFANSYFGVRVEGITSPLVFATALNTNGAFNNETTPTAYDQTVANTINLANILLTCAPPTSSEPPTSTKQ